MDGRARQKQIRCLHALSSIWRLLVTRVLRVCWLKKEFVFRLSWCFRCSSRELSSLPLRVRIHGWRRGRDYLPPALCVAPAQSSLSDEHAGKLRTYWSPEMNAPCERTASRGRWPHSPPYSGYYRLRAASSPQKGKGGRPPPAESRRPRLVCLRAPVSPFVLVAGEGGYHDF